MYTNLLLVEDWVKNLTQEVKGLIIEQPYEKEVTEFGGSYTYREIAVFQKQWFLEEYTSKALSTLSKLDVLRDSKLISELKNELREGQFDDLKTRSLNSYTAKVLGSFSDLWMVGFDFDTFYSYLPKSIMDSDCNSDGERYYHSDESLELGNILYRIRSFFKYSGLGFKADSDEYTIESVLREYANCDSSKTEKPNDDTEPTELGVKLQWNGAANTLYDVFRQLKNHHLPNGETLIEEGYDHIAQFIQQSFIGFDKTSVATIRGELTKQKRPKKSFNRADLDLTELG